MWFKCRIWVTALWSIICLIFYDPIFEKIKTNKLTLFCSYQRKKMYNILWILENQNLKFPVNTCYSPVNTFKTICFPDPLSLRPSQCSICNKILNTKTTYQNTYLLSHKEKHTRYCAICRKLTRHELIK